VLSYLRVGVIGESLCLLMPSMSSDIGGFGEFGEYYKINNTGMSNYIFAVFLQHNLIKIKSLFNRLEFSNS